MLNFNLLVTPLGLIKGNLATHINGLESAGPVEVRKEFVGKVPHTSYRITKMGRTEFGKYWENMKHLEPSRAAKRGLRNGRAAEAS